jgi:hypothetical protein
MIKAVITSDIIRSSNMTSENRSWLIEQIDNKLQTLYKVPDSIMESEIYRGDSFQCLIHRPKLALKTALILKTFVKGLIPPNLESSGEKEIKRVFNVRMSLAVGEVDAETGKIGTSNGEAFRLSGRKLDEMKKLKQTFCITSNDAFDEELATESVLLNFILAKSTALQSQVLALKLEGITEMGIAEKLNIQQAAVNQRATSGGWHAIDAMVKRFENIYANG